MTTPLQINTEPFMEFYRSADPLIRRIFIEAASIAARGEAERFQLREMIRKTVQENNLGVEATIDPRQFNGLLYHCGMLDEMTALTLLEDIFNRASGILDKEDEEDEIPIYDTSEMVNLPPVRWLVEGFIPQESFTLVAGEYGAGKSFIMIDVALHVALGAEWHGRKVEQGSVVYMASEGAKGLQKRIEAWMLHHDWDIDDPIPMLTIPKAVPITHPIHFKKLVEKIPKDTKLIIIDTLHTFMEGDENNAQDIKPMLDAIRELNRMGMAVVVVHHLNKQGDIRGSNSIPAGADAVFRVQRAEHDHKLVQLTCTKQKDFDIDDCPDMFFRMKPVSLETDIDTSLVLILDSENTVQKKVDYGLSKKHFEIWHYVWNNQGADARQVIEATGVSEATWKRGRKKLIELGLLQEKIKGRYWAIKRGQDPYIKK